MKKKVQPVKFIVLLAIRCRRDNIMGYAYNMTYSLLLSFFPFLIFLMTLVGYSDLDSSAILPSLGNYLPREVYDLVSDIMTEVMDHQRNSLMSFSALFAVYAASGGFRSFMEAANRIMEVKERRNIIFRFLLSVFWVILLSIAIIFALLSIVFGQYLLNIIYRYIPYPFDLLRIYRIIVPEIFIFLLFLSFYMFVPSRRICFRCAIPGALLTTAAWIIFTMFFQIYVNTYANYSRFYGTLGAVIILLLWLLFTSVIMLVGLEFNALLQELNIVRVPAKKAEKPLK